MNLTIKWGDLKKFSTNKLVELAISKSVKKIERLIEETEEDRMTFTFKHDPSLKTYMTSIYLSTPKVQDKVESKGFSLVESITEASNDMKRKIRKAKEKVITSHRSKPLAVFL